MHAIRQRGLGGPEVLELVEVPRPEPRDGHVLIEVSRAGVNFTDVQGRATGMRTMVDAGGAPQRLSPEDFPIMPGGEVAGVRADTGQRVVSLCGSGGYAEWAVAPERLTYPLPDGISDEDAIALLVQGTTAWHLYSSCLQLTGRETVVVQAAAGGVGSVAVQLGASMGAKRVVGLASTDKKRELVLALGASEALDSAPEGLTDRVLEANGGNGVDAVFDMTGGSAFEGCFAALAPFGTVVIYGTASGAPPTIDGRSLIAGSRSIQGFWLMDIVRTVGLGAALDDLFERVADGRLRPLVGATYPLGEAARAQQDLLSRATTGKLCLDPRS